MMEKFQRGINNALLIMAVFWGGGAVLFALLPPNALATALFWFWLANAVLVVLLFVYLKIRRRG